MGFGFGSRFVGYLLVAQILHLYSPAVRANTVSIKLAELAELKYLLKLPMDATSLSQDTQHLVMIGDHKQLRPIWGHTHHLRCHAS